MGMTAEDKGYLNFAIALENRAIRKGRITQWRTTSCFPWANEDGRKKWLGTIVVTLPSDKYPDGKVFRRRSGK